MRYTPMVFIEQHVPDELMEMLKPQIEEQLDDYTDKTCMVATAYRVIVSLKSDNVSSIIVQGLGNPLGYIGPDDHISFQMMRLKILPGVRR